MHRQPWRLSSQSPNAVGPCALHVLANSVGGRGRRPARPPAPLAAPPPSPPLRPARAAPPSLSLLGERPTMEGGTTGHTAAAQPPDLLRLCHAFFQLLCWSSLQLMQVPVPPFPQIFFSMVVCMFSLDRDQVLLLSGPFFLAAKPPLRPRRGPLP